MDEKIGALLVNTVPDDATCKGCRWWAAISYRPADMAEPRIGECRRHAPLGGHGFPNARVTDVCGDWEPRP